MKDFVSNNSWLISLIAIFISVFSFSLVVFERIRLWKLRKTNRKLNIEFVALKKIIELDVENFYSRETIFKEFETKVTTNPEFSKLYYIFQSVDISLVTNKEILQQLDVVKNLKSGELFSHKRIPDGYSSSLQFNNDIEKLITMTRRYFSQISN